MRGVLLLQRVPGAKRWADVVSGARSRERWSGPRVTRLRALFATRLPAPCTRCPRPVETGQDWDLDHLVSLTEGGAMWDPANIGVAHASCNRSAGATLGNQRRSRARRRLG